MRSGPCPTDSTPARTPVRGRALPVQFIKGMPMPRVPDGKPNVKALAAGAEKNSAAQAKAAEAAAKAAKRPAKKKKKCTEARIHRAVATHFEYRCPRILVSENPNMRFNSAHGAFA